MQASLQVPHIAYLTVKDGHRAAFLKIVHPTPEKIEKRLESAKKSLWRDSLEQDDE